jgi:N utilization substance protein A
LTARDRIAKEQYRIGDKLKVYVTDVVLTPKGTRVYISRTNPNMLKRLFEKEIPEVYDGTVEIMSIARDAGDRAKVLVRSHNETVDAIGTMVGSKGHRIQGIIRELAGEKMDIIEYNEDVVTLISNALKPARISQVAVREDDSYIAVVEQDQLSLAIGRRGQNVRLATYVTGYKIDIKSTEEFEEELKSFDVEDEADETTETVDEVIEETVEVEEVVEDNEEESE